jgi:predicted dehydrogenase/threonine dehydrogenase-like Zn-dependent dehydrogenase
MKQILQHLNTGETEVAEVPCPAVAPGSLLIRTTASVVSAGTERMLVDFGKASLVGKARSQPEKVRQVIDKARTDGVMATMDAVRHKLDQPLTLGYSQVGVVLDVGAGVHGFSVGDRVVSNGKHAEVVSVPRNLCCRVPDEVSDEDAAYTVLAAISLQGIRLAQPTIGEAVVVTGLGLLGLIAVQLLRAHGCRVLGIDMDPARLALARGFGAEVVDLSAGGDPVAAADTFSRGRGVDAVLLTASTASSDPVHQAALMCRKRGRIVLVGVTGLTLSRADFYEKELTFQVSCSYGPGRYDPLYEDRGADYPVGFVRWTEQRNFEAALDLMASGAVRPHVLTTHRVPIAQAAEAYALLGDGPSPLGIVLEYPVTDAATLRAQSVHFPASAVTGAPASIAMIGAGNYATAVLIPALKAAGARLRMVISRQGVTGVHAARTFKFETVTTETRAASTDPAVNAVVIATRHDSHAALVVEAIRAGRHVFVEKPLALTHADLDAIASTVSERGAGAPIVMVGFNRRFAPHVTRIKSLLASAGGPKAFVMTVNAGAIPASHWTKDDAQGGGRIVGEACHFIDLLRFLAGAPIHEARATSDSRLGGDSATLTLSFADGTIGTIHYLANGHRSFPKERLEVFSSGRILQLDNFRVLRAFGWPGVGTQRLWRQDKGQRACAEAFVRAVAAGGPSPMPLEELLEVSRTAIDLAAQMA